LDVAAAAAARDDMAANTGALVPTAPVGSILTVDAVTSATRASSQSAKARRTAKRIRKKRRVKRMTEAAIRANQMNGSKGRGPTSVEGKKKSRGGALSHGMTAQQPDLLIGEAGEDRAAYAELEEV